MCDFAVENIHTIPKLLHSGYQLRLLYHLLLLKVTMIEITPFSKSTKLLYCELVYLTFATTVHSSSHGPLQAIEETRNVIVFRDVIVYRMHPCMHSESNSEL